MHPQSKARFKVQQAESLAVRLVNKCRLAWWACLSLRLMLDTDHFKDGLRILRWRRGRTGQARRLTSAILLKSSSVSGKGSITVESADWLYPPNVQSTSSKFLNWHTISVSVSASTVLRICTRSRNSKRYSRTLTVLTCTIRYFTPSTVVSQSSSLKFSSPLTYKAPTSSNLRTSERT